MDIKKRQVTIAVKMLEVTRTAKRILGVNITNNAIEPGVTYDANTPMFFNVKNLGKVSQMQMDASIEMLENDDEVRTLSSPILRVVDGKSAEIHSGKTVPVKDIEQNPQYEGGKVVGFTSTETWSEVNLGIKLSVEELQIHHDDEITIKINITQNDADLTNIQPGARFVTTDKTQTTTLRLRDGDTIVMGGLINNQTGKNHIRLPFFYRLPVVGRLFSKKTNQKERSELIIFMTAFIVNKDDVEVVKEKEMVMSTVKDYQY
jgi:type II secretory pathway component GspD/PulD (secretin)